MTHTPAMLRARLVILAVVVALPTLAAGQTPTPAVDDPSSAFFDDSVVHDINVSIKPRDWESLKANYLLNDPYTFDLRWRDPRTNVEILVRSCGIRSRGTGSRSGVKPGLRVDIDEYTKGQRFLGLKSFILRNNTQDASGMRERLSMWFFRIMGLKAVREAHARLFVNGDYDGLYTIVESQDKAFLQKNFGENDGHLYEYHFDNAAVAAGASPYVFQYLGPNPALYVNTPFKPQTKEDDPQGEVIARWIQTINDTTSAAWRQLMAEYLDLEHFIRHLAIENFLAEEDGITGDYGPNNFYLYRFQNTTKFMFLPWDKSNTFWDPNYFIFRNVEDRQVDHRNRLVLRALQDPDLRTLYLETLLECASNAEFLELEVIREYGQIRAAALGDPVKPFTNEDFEQAVVDLKTFARDRSAAVRAQVSAARR
jgi:spore coat protein CotH